MYKRDEFINLQSLYLAHKHSIYSLINPSFPRWIFLICEARKNSEARVGPVFFERTAGSVDMCPSSYKRDVPSSPPQFLGARTRWHADARTCSRVYYTRRSFSFLCRLVGSLARGLLCRFTRAFTSRDRTLAERTLWCIHRRAFRSQVYLELSSNFLRGNSRYILIFITRCLFK